MSKQSLYYTHKMTDEEIAETINDFIYYEPTKDLIPEGEYKAGISFISEPSVSFCQCSFRIQKLDDTLLNDIEYDDGTYHQLANYPFTFKFKSDYNNGLYKQLNELFNKPIVYSTLYDIKQYPSCLLTFKWVGNDIKSPKKSILVAIK